jgi:hypothetical protein
MDWDRAYECDVVMRVVVVRDLDLERFSKGDREVCLLCEPHEELERMRRSRGRNVMTQAAIMPIAGSTVDQIAMSTDSSEGARSVLGEVHGGGHQGLHKKSSSRTSPMMNGRRTSVAMQPLLI